MAVAVVVLAKKPGHALGGLERIGPLPGDLHRTRLLRIVFVVVAHGEKTVQIRCPRLRRARRSASEAPGARRGELTVRVGGAVRRRADTQAAIDEKNQFAVAVASNARITVTLIWPGNVISSAIWLAMSVDISTTVMSSTSRSRT